MIWGFGRYAIGTAAFPNLLVAAMLAAGAMALAGCTPDGQLSLSAAAPRGATVAFESIDGPPAGQFRTLVASLNDEAQSRRLAVIARDNPSAYRVRGYLAARVAKGQTTIAWVWDVFDAGERRALRISGEETTKGQHRDAWTAADDAMLRRIAHASVEQLAAFLTSAAVAPALPSARPVAFWGGRDSSPEAAGIFRIDQADADTVTAETTQAVDAGTDPVPLPRRRPGLEAAVSARETVTLAAASH